MENKLDYIQNIVTIVANESDNFKYSFLLLLHMSDDKFDPKKYIDMKDAFLKTFNSMEVTMLNEEIQKLKDSGVNVTDMFLLMIFMQLMEISETNKIENTLRMLGLGR